MSPRQYTTNIQAAQKLCRAISHLRATRSDIRAIALLTRKKHELMFNACFRTI